jgi:hypothetical protein
VSRPCATPPKLSRLRYDTGLSNYLENPDRRSQLVRSSSSSSPGRRADQHRLRSPSSIRAASGGGLHSSRTEGFPTMEED